MAVYTEVTPDAMATFVSEFGLGSFEGMVPIPQGIENTNYRVDAGGRGWVVTLHEHEGRDRVAADLALTRALADLGVPCPRPVEGVRGFVDTLGGRPVSVTPFVRGTERKHPGEADLEGLGRAVARFHLAGVQLEARDDGPHRRNRVVDAARHLADRLAGSAPQVAGLLRSEADYQATSPGPELPGGVIHADLFLDNILFEPGTPRVVAFLDLHMAGLGPFLFDVAVVLLDGAWVRGGLDGDRARAFLRGYRSVRPFAPAEFAALPALLRRAALRFWCLRLGFSSPECGRMKSGKSKDPEEFHMKLDVLTRTRE